jgi:hypothetical protein
MNTVFVLPYEHPVCIVVWQQRMYAHYPVEQREISTYKMDCLVDKLAMRPFCKTELMDWSAHTHTHTQSRSLSRSTLKKIVLLLWWKIRDWECLRRGCWGEYFDLRDGSGRRMDITALSWPNIDCLVVAGTRNFVKRRTFKQKKIWRA